MRKRASENLNQLAFVLNSIATPITPGSQNSVTGDSSSSDGQQAHEIERQTAELLSPIHNTLREFLAHSERGTEKRSPTMNHGQAFRNLVEERVLTIQVVKPETSKSKANIEKVETDLRVVFCDNVRTASSSLTSG